MRLLSEKNNLENSSIYNIFPYPPQYVSQIQQQQQQQARVQPMHHPYQPYPPSTIPHYPQMSIPMHPVSQSYGYTPEQMITLQQQAAWRNKAPNMNRSRMMQPSYHMGSIPSGGSGPPPGATGRVVDSPSGPIYVWHEVNSMGVVVERAVPYTYLQSSYRSGRDHRINAVPENNVIDPKDQQRPTQRERDNRNDHSKSRLTERRNTNNVDSNNNNNSKRIKIEANGSGANKSSNIESTYSNKSS